MQSLVFGKWKVIEKSEKKIRYNTYWICQCECGVIKDVVEYTLKNGRSKSCGCDNSFHKNSKRNGIEERRKTIRLLLKKGYTQRDILANVITSTNTIQQEIKKLKLNPKANRPKRKR